MVKVKLGDVAKESRLVHKGEKNGLNIVGLEHLTPGNVTLSNWAENIENTFTKKFLKGQVLFGRRRAYLKKAVVAPFDGICSGDITVIEALPGKINSELLPFIIQNDRFFDYAVEKSAGSLSPRVKWEHLKDYEFNLPEIEEQEKLISAVLRIERTKQKIEKAIDKAKILKSSFIEESSATSNCISVKLENLFAFSKGKGLSKAALNANGQNECIHYGELFTVYSEIINEIISKTDEDIKNSRLSEKYDILMPTSDVTPTGLATASCIMEDNILLGGDILILRSKGVCFPPYLSFVINHYKDKILSRVSGTNIKHISAKSISDLEYQIPQDFNIQKKYYEQFNEINKQISALNKHLINLDILQKQLINSVQEG